MNIIVAKEARVTTITINRPTVKNAVDGATAHELSAALKAFDVDDSSDVAVLSGADGCFCAGADLKAVVGSGAAHDFSETGDGPMGPSRLLLKKPVIAAISGHAVAGGLELALFCDMRVADESAVLGVFCRRWGVPLVDGGTIRLPRLIGHSRAMDLILTGRPVSADEALAMALVNRGVKDGTALQAAQTLAREIGRFPQTCLRNDRLSAYKQWDLNWDDAIVNEFRRGSEVIASQETVAGATAFTSGKGRHGSFSDL